MTDKATSISTDTIAGITRVRIKDAHLHLTVMPEIGGKISSLVHMESGREFVLQPPDRPVRRAAYGARFEDYDTSGFDDCFPTVSDCQYPDGSLAGTELPDHGEVWSSAWEYEIRGEELWLSASGRRFPYVMRKRIRLDGDTVVMQYEIERSAKEPFSYIWSAHPLLNVYPGCRILLPSEVKELLVNWSSDGRLGGFGASCPWPVARLSDGAETDLGVLGPRSRGSAQKLFTSRLSTGCCALYYPESNESISFNFETAQAPYLGVWICEGGWPDARRAHYTVALEPCTGRPDSLASAIGRRECESIEPGAKKAWVLRIKIQRGVPEALGGRA